jgi:hypothetical protein
MMRDTLLYVGIWAVLVFATIMEVVTRSLPYGVYIVVTGVLLISIMKAVLIAGVYQHLFRERFYVGMLPVVALAIISTLIIASIAGGS